MAFYISIELVEEEPNYATFSFTSDEILVGEFKLIKNTGEIYLTKKISDDLNSRLFLRASWKIKKHWENNEIPEKTCWAS